MLDRYRSGLLCGVLVGRGLLVRVIGREGIKKPKHVVGLGGDDARTGEHLQRLKRRESFLHLSNKN